MHLMGGMDWMKWKFWVAKYRGRGKTWANVSKNRKNHPLRRPRAGSSMVSGVWVGMKPRATRLCGCLCPAPKAHRWWAHYHSHGWWEKFCVFSSLKNGKCVYAICLIFGCVDLNCRIIKKF